MIEQRSPATILELATAHQRSRVLFALVELAIPDRLAEPATAHEVASSLDAAPLATRALLDAAVELGLVVRDGERYRNGPDAAHYLVRGAPAYLGEFVKRHARAARGEAWATVAERLRAWRPGGAADQLAAAAGCDPDASGQHALALLAGAALADVAELAANRRLLDLGGGTGAMSIALCRRFPALEAIVLEVPQAAPQAAAHVRTAALAGRIEVRAGDFMHDPLPAGCDAVLVANVLSLFDEPTGRALLARAHAALPPGGAILLSGWMRDEAGGGALAALLGVEDLAFGAPEVERSMATYATWLTEAGFEHRRSVRYLDPFCAVTGVRA